MRRGKECAQAAHAAMIWLAERLEKSCYFRVAGTTPVECDLSDAELQWVKGNFRKVTCQVSSEDELRDLHDMALVAEVTAHLVTDAGLTEFGGTPTVTALAIGPDWDEKIDVITGKLELY
jgi:peptidyl-tRNA hydrolase, PTH2 family